MLGYFDYSVQDGMNPWAMSTVTVWANKPLPADCTITLSLNSYKTQGGTWPGSGLHELYDHVSITLDAAHTTGTLTVNGDGGNYDGAIGGEAHNAIEGIDLADEMALP